jgi:hypothetical protein
MTSFIGFNDIQPKKTINTWNDLLPNCDKKVDSFKRESFENLSYKRLPLNLFLMIQQLLAFPSVATSITIPFSF